MALPFFGESRNILEFPAQLYMFHLGQNQNVLFHADSSPDSEGQSLLKAGTADRILKKYGKVPHLFGTWWQQREFACSLSPQALFSPKIPPENWLDRAELCDCPVEYMTELINQLGTKNLFLYAEDGRNLFVKSELQNNLVEKLSFHWKDRKTWMAEVAANTGADIQRAMPHESFTI